MDPDELRLRPLRYWSYFSVVTRQGSEVKPPSDLQAGSSPLASACHPAAGDTGCPGQTSGRILLLGSAHCLQPSAHVGLAGDAEGRRQSHL